MKAVTAIPGKPDSLLLEERPEPSVGLGEMLVETVRVGICGTDHEILDGHTGAVPPDSDRLVLGHEALGRVLTAPEESGFSPGDLVVPIVRRPDPEPCPNCAIGEWDMCRNGKYTEAGIKKLDGYARERFALEPAFGIKVDDELGDLAVLVEPASVVAKAWEHILHIGKRALWAPARVLVTGAGPIGLLAALFAKRHDAEIHVLDQVTEGPKPSLVGELGAMYYSRGLDEITREVDVVLECTGAADLVFSVMGHTGPIGIVCLTGITTEGRRLVANAMVDDLVVENDTIFGTVNANRRHYEEAVRVLSETDRTWLERLVNRRVPSDRAPEAYKREKDDVKTVIEFNTL